MSQLIAHRGPDDEGFLLLDTTSGRYEIAGGPATPRDVLQAGITGWAQVNGRNSISWDERIRYDVQYVKELSFLTDVQIALKTFKAVLFRKHLIAAKDYFKEKTEKAREAR